MYTTQASMKLDDSRTHGAAAELFVVEGDSAARSVANLCNEQFQAVLPLQGKPLNAARARQAKVLASPLYLQLAQALGTRSAIDAAPANGDALRFGKLLLLFDPDADGVHIGALMLLYLQRWMPQLIDAGMVLMVRAPMFALTAIGEAEPAYAWSPEHAQAITRQWQEQGRTDVRLHRFLGLGSIPPQVLRHYCVDPATRISRTVGVEDIAAVQAVFGSAGQG